MNEYSVMLKVEFEFDVHKHTTRVMTAEYGCIVKEAKNAEDAFSQALADVCSRVKGYDRVDVLGIHVREPD